MYIMQKLKDMLHESNVPVRPEQARENVYTPRSDTPSSFVDIRSKMIKNLLRDPGLEEISVISIKKAGANGIDTKTLNSEVANEILEGSIYVDEVIKQKHVRDQLHKIRVKYSKKGLIGFNNKNRVWYFKNKNTYELSGSEERFLRAQGLKPQDCIRKNTAKDVIQWLYNTLSPDEFEQLCCAVLEHLEGREFKVTQKRKSGADGGFDGRGRYQLDNGSEVPVIFEAKKYNPDSQVGSDVCQKLAGAMMENGIKHGIIMTTAQMSENTKKSSQNIAKHSKVEIALIDQEKIVDIMTYREEKPHGLGIFKSDYGLYYINIKAIKTAVSKQPS